MTDDTAKLKEATDAMEAAVRDTMRLPLPRDLDRPWRSVAMRYDLDFFNKHQDAFRAAFERGMASR